MWRLTRGEDSTDRALVAPRLAGSGHPSGCFHRRAEFLHADRDSGLQGSTEAAYILRRLLAGQARSLSDKGASRCVFEGPDKSRDSAGGRELEDRSSGLYLRNAPIDMSGTLALRNSVGTRREGSMNLHGIYIGVERPVATFVQKSHANSIETEHSTVCSKTHASSISSLPVWEDSTSKSGLIDMV